jgi:hypothetical protein
MYGEDGNGYYKGDGFDEYWYEDDEGNESGNDSYGNSWYYSEDGTSGWIATDEYMESWAYDEVNEVMVESDSYGNS